MEGNNPGLFARLVLVTIPLTSLAKHLVVRNAISQLGNTLTLFCLNIQLYIIFAVLVLQTLVFTCSVSSTDLAWTFYGSDDTRDLALIDGVCDWSNQ